MKELLDAVVRKNPAQPIFHALPGDLIDGKTGMGPRAVLYLSYLLTRPADFLTSIASLVNLYGDKRTAIANALGELEERGYLRRSQQRGASGRGFGRSVWQVSYTPDFCVYTESVLHTICDSRKPDIRSDGLSKDGSFAENEDVMEKGVIAGFLLSGNVQTQNCVDTESAAHRIDKLPENKLLASDVTGQIMRGDYNFLAPERNLPDVSTPFIITSVKEAEKKEGKGGVGEKRETAPLTPDEQRLWQEGWTRGYTLMTDASPRALTSSGRRSFKTLCKELLRAVAENAQRGNLAPVELAIAQLYSIFENHQIFTSYEITNWLSTAKGMDDNFEKIKNKRRQARRGEQSKAPAPRPQLTPEQFEQHQAQRKQQHDLMRGFTIPEGQAHFTGDKPPRRPEDDYPDDDDFTT